MPRLRLCALAAALSLGLWSQAAGADLAVVGARIYPAPTAAAIEAGTVLVHDGRIAAVGPQGEVVVPDGAELIDGRGKVVVAGFWNSHLHILPPPLLHADERTAAELQGPLDAMLNRWGFTSVFDLASVLDNTLVIRRRIVAGELRGPLILTAGEPFYSASGPPIYVRGYLASQNIILPEDHGSIPGAVARERAAIARGADGVKLFTGNVVGGQVGVEPMDLGMAKALTAEAHRQHRPVFAHPTNGQGLDVALESGVDILAHTADGSGPWSPGLVKRMIDQGVALVPTLTLFEVEGRKNHAAPETTARVAALVQGQLRAFHAAGGQVLFGTDVGYIDTFDTTEEYRMMAAAGLDWRAILASLTVNPAARFGLGERKGILARGHDADLVVLEADPAEDVAAFAKVAHTIRAGQVIYSAPQAGESSTERR